MIMALNEAQKANFETLLRAALSGDLCLAQGRDVKTGEERAILCAVYQDKEGMFNFVPFGHLANGNPYEEYQLELDEDSQ